MERPISIVRAGPGRGENNTDNQQIASTSSQHRLQLQQRRLPLRSRDANNVMAMRGPQKGSPLTSKSGNATLQDKHASRVTMPTLGAPAGKPPNKGPLTPRVAATKTPVTPRLRQDFPSISTVPQRDDITTPVSTFLTNNITPRSSSRKSRVDSASSTPTSTPTGTSAQDAPRVYTNTPIHGTGLGVIGSEAPPRRLAVSFSPSLSEVEDSRDPSHMSEEKFFYADDVKNTTPAPLRRPVLTTKSSASSFLYANGEIIPQGLASPGSNIGSTYGDEKSKPKFFHANGRPGISSSPSFSSNPSNATASTISPLPANSLTHGQAFNSGSPWPWASPTAKASDVVPANDSNPPSVLFPTAVSRPQPLSQNQPDLASPRRNSLEKSPRSSGHTKSTSLTKLELSEDVTTTIRSPPASAERLTGVNLVTPGDVPDQHADKSDLVSEAQSPIKPADSLERMNELAANARRERKVLDLEITNSSLAAINRTLEREMRKQTAELRRFRRLSRSGRLSINTASMRTSVTSLATEGADSTQLSDLSEDLDSDDDYGSDSSGVDSPDDGSLSPRALAESDARHRKRDEKRLQLDLSKHQQLLIDSQKMNQSLKRCLGWTEELITEGRKALAYQVRVSDVELGGRVLALDDIEDNEHEDISISVHDPIIPTSDSTESWNKQSTGDRDSGIEVTADRNLEAEGISPEQQTPLQPEL